MYKIGIFLVLAILLSACAVQSSPAPTQPYPGPPPPTIPVAARTVPTTPPPAAASVPPATATPAFPTSVPGAIQHLQPGALTSLVDIAMLDASQGWATASDDLKDQHILRTQDGGRSWQDVTPPEPASAARQDGKRVVPAFLDSQHAWAVYWTNDQDAGPVFSGEVWCSTDGGASWQQAAPLDDSAWAGGYATPISLLFTSPADGKLALAHDPGAGQAPVSIFSTSDGGASWQAMHTPLDEDNSYLDACCQTGLAFLDARTGLVTKSPGPLGRTYLNWTHDGGATWEYQEPPAADDRLFNSGLCGTASPIAIPPGILRMVVSCLQDALPNTGPGSFLYSTSDKGSTWNYAALPAPPWDSTAWPSLHRSDALDFVDPVAGWLAATADYENPAANQVQTKTYLYQTGDAGATWEDRASFDGAARFDFVDAAQGWMLLPEDQKTILQRTTDGGTGWVKLNPVIQGATTQNLPSGSQPGVSLDSVRMVDDKHGWALAHSGQNPNLILHTSDGGLSWSEVTPLDALAANPGTPLTGTALFLDASNAWVTYVPSDQALSKPALVWHTADGGASWQPGQPLPSEDLAGAYTPIRFSFIDPKHGWLLMAHGAAAGSQPVSVYQTSDSGATWQLALEMLSPMGGTINTCCQSGFLFSDSHNGLITTNFGPDPVGRVNWTHDGGASWERQDLPLPAENLAQSFCGTTSPVYSPPNAIFLVMECQNPAQPVGRTDAYLYQTLDFGANWTSSPLPDPPLEAGGWHYNRRDCQVQFIDPQTGWLYISDFYETGDGQRTQVLTDLYQTGDAGQSWQSIGKFDWGGQLGFVDPRQGWALAAPQADTAIPFLLHSQDGGQTWQPLSPQFEIHTP